MGAPQHKTGKGARPLEPRRADEGLTAFAPEINAPPRNAPLEIVDSAHAAMDPLAAFAVEPSAPARERAQEPQRLVKRARRKSGRQHRVRVYGLAAFSTAAGLLAFAVLTTPDETAARRFKMPLAQVANRAVRPAPAARQQQLDAPAVAEMAGTTQSIRPTADAVPVVQAPPVQSPRIQTPAPKQIASPIVAQREVPPTIAAAPVRLALPAEEDSPRPPVSGPVATAGRDAALSAPPPPVPTAGAAVREAVVASRAEPPAAAVTPPPASPTLAAPPARGTAERAAVEAVLGQYASAFTALDARRAKAVWPTVNQKNLERAFDSLEEQVFDLGECDITVLPPRALALCDGTARYTPKVGNRKPRTEARRWSFALRQTGPDWAIENVNLR